MNIELFEGQSCLVHVKLPDEWEVYGGSPKGEFRAERESLDSVLVTVPAMEAEFSPLVPYELFARRRSDGKEWLVLSGQLHVRRRYSDVGGGIAPIEYFVEPQLVEDGISSSPQIIVGIPGPQGPKGDKGEPGDGNVTAEAIQAVVPIAWGAYVVRFGLNAEVSAEGTSIGYKAKATGLDSTAVGFAAEAKGQYAVTVGARDTKANSACSITVGSLLHENVNGQTVTHTCTTQGTGSITIGAGANTLNTTASDGTVTESCNSVTIGCKASNTGADSVVIGAQASGTSAFSVSVGVLAQAKGFAVAVGRMANAVYTGTAIGAQAKSTGAGFAGGFNSSAVANSIAIGGAATATADQAIVIGKNATVSDYGAVVFRSTAEDGTYTQLYFSGANTPLANTYHGGAPMLGYVTKDSAGNIVAAGTRSLIDLLTDNSTFQPASLDENGEWGMPKVFHPSDLDLPTEEPSEVEEYQPLPVYPIVEPDDIMGDNGTLEQGGPSNTSPQTNA